MGDRMGVIHRVTGPARIRPVRAQSRNIYYENLKPKIMAPPEGEPEAGTSALDGNDEDIMRALHADVGALAAASPLSAPPAIRAPTTTFSSNNSLPLERSASPSSELKSLAVSTEKEGVFRRRRLTREHINGEIESPPKGLADPYGSEAAAALTASRASDALAPAGESLPPRRNKRGSRRISREICEKETVGREEREQPLFPKAGALGTFSAHGIEPGEGVAGGVAKINQDCGCVCYPFADDAELALLVVMDGHGPEGEKVSSIVHCIVHYMVHYICIT